MSNNKKFLLDQHGLSLLSLIEAIESTCNHFSLILAGSQINVSLSQALLLMPLLMLMPLMLLLLLMLCVCIQMHLFICPCMRVIV